MMPAGTIVLWFGTIGNIPSGWILCNGAGGSPDLRNKFVVGAGDTYGVDAVGGAATHTHPFLGDGHTHTIPGGVSLDGGPNFSTTTSSSQASGTSDAGSTLPPYHALAYIMKT